MHKLLSNILVEKTIIGAIIFGNVNLNKIFLQIKPEYFFLDSHKIVFEILHRLYKQNQSFEIIDINNLLLAYTHIYSDYRFDFEEIRNLSNQNFIQLYLDDYIILLVEKYIRRSILNLAYNLIESAENTSIDLPQLLETTSSKLTNIINPIKQVDKLKPVDKIFLDISQYLLEHGSLSGLKSGFRDIDYITRGFQQSDLIILAARPSIGKTAFALNIASNVARNSDKKVLYFSLEMSREQLFLRLVSLGTNTSRLRLEDLRINAEQLLQIQQYSEKVSNILIDDSGSINHYYIENQLQEYKNKKNDISLVIIDYLQLMQDMNSSNRQDIKRAQELSNITRNLKNIARNFNLPIILISQVGRAVESRLDKRPLLSDLKDSGCIASHNYVTLDFKMIPIKINKLFFHKSSKILSKFLSHFCLDKYFFINHENCFSYGHKPIYHYEFYHSNYLELSANHMLSKINYWIRTDHVLEMDFFISTKYVALKNNQIILYSSWISDLYFSPIPQFTFISFLDFAGFHKTYDLTIDLTHNFLVNKIILHNSIEQDADLVFMLYRESYYNQDIINIDETELIIAKHRNGPLGTVKLSFNPVYMSFSDYK
uniref:Replicative DNA helicase n=1 Tax=Porphyridium sordidum TaxID=28024 RepID=A0A1C9CDT4_PORSO|nr:replication helicase subunit [Porphyridium sordidum]AOM66549.1 replication helicase subunit [Porphyridium sordidum]